MGRYIDAGYIECDGGCSYIGNDFITDYNSTEGRNATVKRGFDVLNPDHLSHIQTCFSGYICPSCGKFDSVQVLPDYKPMEGDLERTLNPN